MKLDDLKEHCLKTLKQTEKFPTKTFEEHALVLRLIENQTSVIAELEEIKAELQTEKDKSNNTYYAMKSVGLSTAIKIIDKRIAELKGENNE